MEERKIIVENLSKDKFNLRKESHSKEDKYSSKGVRLNWTSLSEVKSVALSDMIISGKNLSDRDLSQRNNNTIPNNILIP